MGSFRLKLVSYFALIAVVPTGLAFYGFDTLGKRHETQKIDSRLRANVRFAVGNYSQQLGASERRAQLVPVDVALERLRWGLDTRDTIVAVSDGRIVAGPFLGKTISLSPGSPASVMFDHVAYRGAISYPIGAAGNVQFASLTPERRLDDAITGIRLRIIVGLVGAVLAFAALTYLLGLSVVRSLARLIRGADAIARGELHERVEVRGTDEFARVGEAFNRMASQLELRVVELEAERRRTREAIARFGDALAATHDPEQLLRIVVETAVEVTGATGGVVVGADGELARAGDLERGRALLELPLRAGRRSFGTLVLAGPGFDEGSRESGTSLVSHAVVALENAHLHRVVERQARVDELTGLANRRAIEETLRTELARAERFNGELCLVFADLDNFKDVNDRFGHPFGDTVLTAFAQTLTGTVRDIDLAGRWGGEEFALVLPGTSVAGGAAVAERARVSFACREIVSADGEHVPLSASFGVAGFPAHGDLESLVAMADEALYRAKRSGKNCVATPLGLIPR